MFSKIHHIGYAVNNIESARELFLKIHGYEVASEKVSDCDRGIYIQFLQSDNYLIELVEGMDEKSPVMSILNRGLPTPYHICYEVESIAACIEELKRLKFKQTTTISDAIAIENRKVAFFVSAEIGLIELVEKQNNEKNLK